MTLAGISANLSPLMLVAAIMLTLMGMTLVGYSARVKKEQLTRRVDLVGPRAAAGIVSDDTTTVPIRETVQLHGSAGTLPEREQREILRFLSALHIPAENVSMAFFILRLLCVTLLGAGAFLLASQWTIFAGRNFLVILVALVFAIVGWFVPAFVIGRAARSRAKAAASGLPDALELLVVCVEAGLALEDGIDRMVIELRHSHPELAEELALTSADLKILPSRDQALMKLAERIDVPSVRSVVTTLSQTMRYGTPLAQAMRVVATEMRNDSLIELEERANRLPTLLTLPMMLFIMPTIFLIVGGPAALRVIDTFMH